MRTILNLFLWALLAHAFSCGKETAAAFQLPTNVYTITTVHDIANNSNASDLRIGVTFLATANVNDLTEARLVIVKTSKSFTLDQLSTLAASSFFSMPLSATAKQVIKPIGANDTDGDPVVNGTPYQVYVATLGKEGTRQLSNFKVITLTDQPIFAGDYLGTWQDLGPPGPGSFPMSLRIADDYTGRMFYASDTFTPFSPSGAQDATTTMVVTGNTISFDLNQFIPGYSGSGAPGGSPAPNCPESKTLTVQIVDDINLVFDTFSWSDCDGTRDVKLSFTRQ